MTHPPDSTGERHDASMGRIARSGSLNVVGAGIGGVLTIVVTWQVANGASTSVAGSLFAATSVFLIVAALAELGSDVSLARFLPRSVAAGARHEALTCIWAAVLATLAAGVVVTIGLIAFRHGLAGLIASDEQADSTARALVVLALGVPAAAVMSTLLSATRGFATVRATVLLEKVGRGSLQVALLAAVFVADGDIAALTVAWALPYLLGAVAAAGWLVVVVRRVLPRDRPEPAAPRPPLIAEYAAFTWPRAVARLFQMILQRADIVLVASLRSPTEAAVYTVATRFLVVGQLGTLAIQQVVAPLTSRLMALGDNAAAARVFQTTSAWSMALTWPLYVLTLGGAAQLLRLFGGADYTRGATVVVVLSLAALVAAACGPVDTILLMTGRSRLSLINNFVAMAVDLGLLLLFLRRYGIVAAALAWAAAVVAKNVLGLWQVYRLHGWFPFSRSAGVVAAISALTFGLSALVIAALDLGRAPVVAGLLTVATVAYCGLLYRFRAVLSLHAFASLLPGRGGRGADRADRADRAVLSVMDQPAATAGELR